MPRVIHEQKCLAIVLRVCLVDARATLVNCLLNILVGWIAQGDDLISCELQTAQTGSDNLDVIHGLIDINETFLALDLAQLVVLTASDDNGSLFLRLEVLVDIAAAEEEFIFDAEPATYAGWFARLNHNKNYIICNVQF